MVGAASKSKKVAKCGAGFKGKYVLAVSARALKRIQGIGVAWSPVKLYIGSRKPAWSTNAGTEVRHG